MRKSSKQFRKYILGAASFELAPQDIYYALAFLVCRVRIFGTRKILLEFRRFLSVTEKWRQLK